MQTSFFSDQSNHETIELESGRLDLYFSALFPLDADHLFQDLLKSLQWRQDSIRIHGRVIPVPRLQAWYGDPGADFSYSGIDLTALPWSPALRQIRSRLQDLCNEPFNSVLCNLYRDGSDSVSWHADNEPELGANPLIASVSLGAIRRFQLKPRRGKGDTVSLELPHNSVLVMSGPLQHHWIHQVPKTRQSVGPRVNLTFRQIKKTGGAPPTA